MSPDAVYMAIHTTVCRQCEKGITVFSVNFVVILWYYYKECVERNLP